MSAPSIARLRIVDGPINAERTLEDRFMERMDALDNDRGWGAAGADWLRAIDANMDISPKTALYYYDRIAQAAEWFATKGRDGAGLELRDFQAKDMRAYMSYRKQFRKPNGEPLADATRRGDAIAIKLLIEFAGREGYLSHERPLRDYEIPKGKRAFTTVPADVDVGRLIAAASDRWNPRSNPKAVFVRKVEREFFAARNAAVISLLADTATRIGAALAARVEDYDRQGLRLTFRATKGGDPLTVPLSADCRDAIDAWLRVRRHSKGEYLFSTIFGGPVDYKVFLHSFHRDAAWAMERFGATRRWTLHSLRHYALGKVSLVGVRQAQELAGHKNIKTTEGYLHAIPEPVVKAHAEARSLGAAIDAVPLLRNRRSDRERDRRRKIV